MRTIFVQNEIKEQILKMYVEGEQIQHIYDMVKLSRRYIDVIIKSIDQKVKDERKSKKSSERKKYKNEKNKVYREQRGDPLSASVKRQHIIDVQVLSAEKYYD